ncbi:MAG: DUF1854 domain-containing protein [Candidatus Latescibacteria bacterium]|nr:DUF1854 domain-containing protein [Candidatus Latescibacterota bacterium]MBT4139408.1 DUF1854 domain-containing protein [Candidatus Latescibacterota bacterium]
MNQLTDQLTFLPQDAKFYLNAFHDLTLETADDLYENVTAERAFPLNAPDQLITVRDNEKNEIGQIEDMRNLDPDSYRVLQDALDQTYFLPQIIKIHASETKFRIPKWTVETDLGPREFEIPSTRRDLRVVGDGRILLRDADGNRYEIRDYRKLDPDSLAIVETLI